MTMKQFIAFAYIFTLVYGATCYFIGEILQLLTVMLIGLPLLLYAFLDLAATPAIAAVMGFYSRRSIPTALFLGYPLVLLTTFVFPTTVPNGQQLVPVPWLSLYKNSVKDDVLAAMPEWMAWYSALFAVSFIVGRISLRVRPPADAEPAG